MLALADAGQPVRGNDTGPHSERDRGKDTVTHVARPILTALAALAANPCAAGAAPMVVGQEAANAPVIIERIGQATLLEALARIGAQAERLDDSGKAFRVVFASGARALLQRTACKDDSCAGLLMLGLFTLPEDGSVTETDKVRRSFSATYNSVSVITNERGEHVVKSYVIADGGITPANLAVQIGVFGDAVAAYSGALYGAD